MSKAWTTLLTQPSYLAGVLVLHRTLQSLSKYPLVVMATDTLPTSCRDVLKASGIEVVDVNHISVSESQHSGFDAKFARFNDAWTKLAVFGLEGYERVILVDADMLFLKSMDDLFDLELPGDDWIAAAPACVCNPLKIAHYPSDWVPENCMISTQSSTEPLDACPIPKIDGPRTSHLLNSGLVVLQPSPKILQGLMHHLQTSPTIANVQFADQDVIAEAFHGRWKPLPWYCNALKPLRAAHRDTWVDTEVRNIHYILDKPWDKRPSSIPPTSDMPATSTKSDTLPTELVSLVADSPRQKSATEYEEVHQWWWVTYVALVGELKSNGREGIWKEMDKYVAQ